MAARELFPWALAFLSSAGGCGNVMHTDTRLYDYDVEVEVTAPEMATPTS